MAAFHAYSLFERKSFAATKHLMLFGFIVQSLEEDLAVKHIDKWVFVAPQNNCSFEDSIVQRSHAETMELC